MKYEELEHWTRLVDLMGNRIDVINQMLGYGVSGAVSNPLRLVYRRGTYRVMFADSPLCEFGIYDLDTLQRAYERVEGLNDGIWHLKRLRHISVCKLGV